MGAYVNKVYIGAEAQAQAKLLYAFSVYQWRESLVGANPESGDVIPETGGVRKLRWALPGGGKRGGARVIYFFHSERLPVFLLSMYGKNEKANLSTAERNAMASVVTGNYSGLCERSWSKMTKTKNWSGRPVLKKSPTVDERIIEGPRRGARLVERRGTSGPSHTCAAA